MKTSAVALYAFQNPVTSDLDKSGVPDHMAAAILLGQDLAERGITVVTGGMRDGLMGLVATAALQAGGHVIGVIPEDFPVADRHPGITDNRVVTDGYERKRMMMELSDASITMAGGVGTCAEYYNEADIMKEVGKGYAVAQKYGVSPDRPVVLFDPTGGKFHSPVQALAKNMGAVKRNSKDEDALVVATNVRQALLEAKVISQKEYDAIYSKLRKELKLSSREDVDKQVKPISPKERKREFRRAAVLMMGGIAGLALAITAPRMIPGAMDAPHGKALATSEAPVISDAELRSIPYDVALARYKGQALSSDTPESVKKTFEKLDRIANTPAISAVAAIAGDVSLALSLTGIFTLVAGGLVESTAKRRPPIVVPELKPPSLVC